MTKNSWKTIPFEPTHTYMAHIREYYPREFAVKRKFQALFYLFHYCTYLANHQPKLVSGTQGDGSTSFTPPSRRKSIHLYTFPSFRSSGRQDCDISLICEAPRPRSHILTCDNIPCKDQSASKSYPNSSWS